ncbi:hypothetical protein HOU00_gp395 [Caulobacter phage CcrPW]|uniref:Uncharacterized protein n=1 Tax=Caulobacter phage CcrPW TaxID=2283271 RepID=A0A385EAM5_9CAUD|nr:hypothetical protein HOU00_gp395 [Caulobacter phage CcrPW]AXQ68730.1 hypothetical protein CcrPW_gp191 [Caulobacter phage CcrPW]
MSKSIPIYDGAIEANHVGSFVKMGEAFQVIRPGYDAQGNARAAWTQFVHDGIPVFEEKVKGPLSAATRSFDRQWAQFIGDDRDLMLRALEACKKEHRAKFRDGRSGVEPAPTVHDTRTGTSYVA